MLYMTSLSVKTPYIPFFKSFILGGANWNESCVTVCLAAAVIFVFISTTLHAIFFLFPPVRECVSISESVGVFQKSSFCFRNQLNSF